ncbi:MAG: LacI family DNA-binding transcriptional regulator [Mycoplasmatales bacterium]
MRKKRDVKYVTIKDVAKKANVSIATVSRVINNGVVKSERKIRVLNAINELNYTPNNSARNLASVSQTKRVAILSPFQDGFYSELLQGFKEGLIIYKYEAVIEVFYNEKSIYESLCDKFERSSEVKMLVQLGEKREILHKELVDINNQAIEFRVDDKFKNKKIGLCFGTDDFANGFFQDVVFKGDAYNTVLCSDLTNIPTCDIYITKNIDTAVGLHNNGVTKPIYSIESGIEISKLLPNIQTLAFDSYKLGVTLARLAIKKTIDDETGVSIFEIK